MGITIHWDSNFTGTKQQLKSKLQELAEIAEAIGFRSDETDIYEVDYATDHNTRDQYTPMMKNEETDKWEIHGAYRWAKIQAEPRGPILGFGDSPKVEAKKKKELAKLATNKPLLHGFVLSLWWGEGCEATNLSFVSKNGGKDNRRRKWTGSGFTKTQFASNFVTAHTTVCSLLKNAERIGLVCNVRDEAEFYETGDITTLIDNGESNLRMIAGLTKMFQDAFGSENIKGNGVNAQEMLKDYDIGQNDE